MLPQYQYEHYYDELCQFCENEMVTLDERCEEGGTCIGSCKRTICEDCREGQTCTVCEETICDGCAEDVGCCQFCPDFIFCEGCLSEHKENCTRLTRAERKLETLTESLESKQHEKARLKRRLIELSQELEDISEQKDDAEDWVKELRRRGS